MSTSSAFGSDLDAAPTPVTVPRIRGQLAGDSWQALTGDASDEGSARTSNALSLALSSMLNAENIVVLAGLGTSLGLNKRLKPGESAGAPAMETLYAAISSLDGFDRAAALAPDAVAARNVEALLSTCQFHVALNGDVDVQTFLASAEQTILRLCTFVDADTDLTTHELFLRKIGRRQAKLSRAQIYTTNYDLAFETAAERSHFHLIDGFGFGTAKPFDGNTFDLDIVRRNSRSEAPALEANVVHLLKLHGSVDWDEVDGGVRRAPAPKNPVLIYPAQNKFQLAFRFPYLESMSRFQIALRQPNITVIIVGFGFNDAHIAAPIEAAIRANIGLRLVVVDPRASSSSNVTLRRIESLIEAGDQRLITIESTFAQFVKLLPDAGAPNERELHEYRTSSAWTK